MARRKKSSGMEGAVLVVAVIIGAIAAIPKEVWIGGGAIALLVWGIYLANKPSITPQASPSKPSPSQTGNRAVSSSSSPHSARAASTSVSAVPVSVSSSTASTSFRIPAAPKVTREPARWVQPEEVVEIAGLQIRGGLFYFGGFLSGPYGGDEPSLIDPGQYVGPQGDFTERQTHYWPHYSNISASAKRAYLSWLADGRRHPEADIGYVFIFFYGLERRALKDAVHDAAARADIPHIAAEVRALLSVYGEQSGSFNRYASNLLDWLEVGEIVPQLYRQPVPEFIRSSELPFRVRLALGQASVDGVPVPAPLALAWARLEPTVSLRTPAIRCQPEFDRLFCQRYGEWFGEGIVLPRNRTKLKFMYHPASSAIYGTNELARTFGETPDVTALTAPVKKLADLVESCTKELESFSRQLAKKPDARTALDGLLLLPATLWPETAQQVLDSLRARMGSGMLVLGFGELVERLGGQGPLTRDKAQGLARALESLNIAMEPDVLAGAKIPKLDDKVALFAVPAGEAPSRDTAAYQAATLTLQLASAMAAADGSFSPAEINHLREQIQAWNHLTPDHHRRLMAHMRLLIEAPVSLTSLKKKLEPLDKAAREAIGAFMATLAQADGVVSPEEVKLLEKIYKLLGIDQARVFSDVHVASAGGQAVPAATPEGGGFRLDPARIAALQADTEKVSVLLASIFQEEVVEAPVPKDEPVAEIEAAVVSNQLLGLDEAHSALVRLLLSRQQWSREELLDAATDLDLMLDGALEHINEAAFDLLDMPLLEGEDPVELNSEALEKMDT